MAKLADAPDLGSGGQSVQVQLLLPAPFRKSDYSGFFLFTLSIPTLVPGNEARKVYFVSMPTNSKPQVVPAAIVISIH